MTQKVIRSMEQQAANCIYQRRDAGCEKKLKLCPRKLRLVSCSRLWAFLSVSIDRQADDTACYSMCKELANYTLRDERNTEFLPAHVSTSTCQPVTVTIASAHCSLIASSACLPGDSAGLPHHSRSASGGRRPASAMDFRGFSYACTLHPYTVIGLLPPCDLPVILTHSSVAPVIQVIVGHPGQHIGVIITPDIYITTFCATTELADSFATVLLFQSSGVFACNPCD
ncbi:hypothetical protein DPX16_4797 [Anabarilius grahami]|uniref:Uncharacterized protein n=1 Tax=Anabarilius grahami TaxID=495550 RepID=A0A3N0Z126_ANAGA|nr:hypothetical protein DPX16_4797 [Anabarilius grahami]